jgi:hypothetical protein
VALHNQPHLWLDRNQSGPLLHAHSSLYGTHVHVTAARAKQPACLDEWKSKAVCWSLIKTAPYSPFIFCKVCWATGIMTLHALLRQGAPHGCPLGNAERPAIVRLQAPSSTTASFRPQIRYKVSTRVSASVYAADTRALEGDIGNTLDATIKCRWQDDAGKNRLGSSNFLTTRYQAGE